MSQRRPRKRLLALLIGLLTLALTALGFGLALTGTAPSVAAGATTAPTTPAEDDTELDTLALPAEDDDTTTTPVGEEVGQRGSQEQQDSEEQEGDGDTQLPTLADDTTAPTTSWQLAPPPVVQAGSVVPIRLRADGEIDGSLIDKTIYLDGAPIGNSPFAHRNYDFQLDTAGLAEGVHVLRGTAEDEAGNTGEAIAAFTIDGTGPTITVKPESIGAGTVFSNLDLKLFDAGQVDYVVVNDVVKDLTDDTWSDVNDIVLGSYGIQSGVPFTVVAYDVVGNSSTATFTIDGSGPTITVKASPDSVGGPNYFGKLSLKLYDAFQVDKVVINGVPKDLTNNAWSDVNFLTVGQYGIQSGVPFTVVAFDVAGNSTSRTFVLDDVAPVLGWQVHPRAVESGSTDWLAVLIDGHLELGTHFTWSYVVDGVPVLTDTRPNWGYNYSFDTTTVADGTHTVYARACDEAGNCGVSSTITFVVDNSGPTITVKTADPASVGSGTVFSNLSLKLYDPNKVDAVVVNGETKDLTDNPWSDVNFITVDSFGIQEGVPFTVKAVDVFGNSTTATFTIDVSKPTAVLVTPTTAGPHAALDIRVDATDNVGLTRIVANVYSGSTLVKSTQTAVGGALSGTHTALVNLPDGTYTIRYNASDLAGNIAVTGSFVVTVDGTGPVVTKKIESIASSLSLKLYDPSKVAYAEVNGVVWELSDNPWSDLNEIEIGDFGIQDGVPFLVKVYDVLGNVTTVKYVLTTTEPTGPVGPVS